MTFYCNNNSCYLLFLFRNIFIVVVKQKLKDSLCMMNDVRVVLKIIKTHHSKVLKSRNTKIKYWFEIFWNLLKYINFRSTYFLGFQHYFIYQNLYEFRCCFKMILLTIYKYLTDDTKIRRDSPISTNKILF
jgi:hypothetical protein